MTSTRSNDEHDAESRRRAALDVILRCLTVDRWVNLYPIIRDNFQLIDEYGEDVIDEFDRTARSDEFARNFSEEQISKYLGDILNVRRILAACQERGLSRTFAMIDLQSPDPSGAALADLLDQIDQEPELPQRICHLRSALQLATVRSIPLQASLHLALGQELADDSSGDPGQYDEEALEHLQWALNTYIRDADWQYWALSHSTIAQLYGRRTLGDRADNIERAIQHFHSALQYYSHATPPIMYARLAVTLASYCVQRVHGDPRENLARAIECCESALRAMPRDDDPQTWALAHAQLCDYYVRAGQASSKLADIVSHADAACEVFTEATNSSSWADVQTHVGHAYLQHYYHCSHDPQALESGIERLNAALRVVMRANDEERWARIHMLLGEAYKDRVVGDLADNVERAIACFELALEVKSREASPDDWAGIQGGLGTCFVRRVAGDAKKNRARAIRHYENALQVIDRHHSPYIWAMIQHNLATAYWDPTDPLCGEYEEQAIAHSELALEIRTKAQYPYDWAATQTNLANYYLYRSAGSRTDNIARAIEHATAALDVRTREAYPSDWAQNQALLGVAFIAAADVSSDADQREVAASYFERALEVYRPETYPDACRRVASMLGDLAFERKQWERATGAYETAAAAIRVLYDSALFRRTRRLQQNQVVPHHHAAYALARLGRAHEAVVMLERGRALELRTLLAAHDESLAAASMDRDALEMYRHAHRIDRMADAADRFIGLPKIVHLSGQEATAVVRQITERTLQSMPNTLYVIDDNDIDNRALLDTQLEIFTRMRREREAGVREARESAARLRSEAVDHLRRIPGLERFASDSTFNEIAEAVARDCPIIFMAATTKGSIAFIVRRDKSSAPAVDTVWLDEFSSYSACELVTEWRHAQEHPTNLEEILEGTLATLGRELMAPIVTRLTDLGFDRAILLPAGDLAFLPLHAAQTVHKDQVRYVFDSVDITYAPSARAVAVARSEMQTRKRDTPSLLAVGNPRPVDMPLPFAHEEVMRASRLFDPAAVTMLFETSASVSEVLYAASTATHVHFACHCVVNWTEPLHSWLELADLPLLLRDIFYQHSNVWYQHSDAWKAATLVVVSACQSGAPDVAAPDEAISWPSAFLLAGVPTVIAAQWPVDDASTALLMSRFYELLRGAGGEPAMDAVIALSRAQRWLRTVTLRELRECVGRGVLGESVVAEIAARVEDDDPDYQPFLSSPFDWAAFGAYGI